MDHTNKIWDAPRLVQIYWWRSMRPTGTLPALEWIKPYRTHDWTASLKRLSLLSSEAQFIWSILYNITIFTKKVMACSNSTVDVNNQFFPASREGMATVTVAYGPYMNWGRWNHNTRRINELKDLILGEGYAVQLHHHEEEKGEGWVSIILGEEELVRNEDVQHNRNYRRREEMLQGMGRDAVEKLSLIVSSK